MRSEGPADGAPGESKDSAGKGGTAERESIAAKRRQCERCEARDDAAEEPAMRSAPKRRSAEKEKPSPKNNENTGD